MRIQTINTYNDYRRLNNKNVSSANTQTEIPQETSFKGKFGDKIAEVYAKYYAEKMMNQKWLHNSSKKLAGASNLMTQHMATLGSFLTSSVYFVRTIKNKDLDPDKRTTLGINQIGCFIIPTICGYLADRGLRGFNKKMEYAYSGEIRHQLATGKISGEKAEKLISSFGSKLKGFGALMGLATFTLIYRYGTPVLITPLANWIGDKWNENKAQKANIAKEFTPEKSNPENENKISEGKIATELTPEKFNADTEDKDNASEAA